MASHRSFSFMFVILAGLGLAGAGAPCSEGGTCTTKLTKGMIVLQHRVAAGKTAPYGRQASSRRRMPKLGTQILETAAKDIGPGQKMINGSPCDPQNIVVVDQNCIPGSPHFDPEGMICANDGHHLHEGYCSYGVGASHCAYCKSGSVPACKGNRDTWDAGFGLCETYKNENQKWCSLDQKDNLFAAEVCSECGLCTQAIPECAKIPKAAISGHNKKHLTGQTVESCARACFGESWCKSFDWYKGKGGCDLSDKSAADVGGLKHNYNGDPYDHYACESVVSVSTKSIIPNAAISGHNKKHLVKQTVESCSQACMRQTWCKSFDWYKQKKACDLSDKSASDVGGLRFDYPPYDHYPVVRSMGRKAIIGEYQDQQIMAHTPMMNTSVFVASMGSISLGMLAVGFLVLTRARKQAGRGADLLMVQTEGAAPAAE